MSQRIIEITYLLEMNFTITTISYLKDLSPKFKIESTTKWRYHYLDQFTTMEVHDFIRNIKNDNVYLIIPNISTSRNINDQNDIKSSIFSKKKFESRTNN